MMRAGIVGRGGPRGIRAGLGVIVALAALAALQPAEGQRPHPGPPVQRPRMLPDEAVVVHVANAGIALLSEHRRIILFDVLFREGVDGYRTVPPETRRSYEGPVRIAEGIVLAVASHHHPDHFDAAAVIAHLTENPGSRFVSTPEAVARIEALEPGAAVLDRVHASYPEEGERETFEFGDVRLETLNLHHGRGEIPTPNLGHLVDSGGFRALHMGDTQVTVEEILAQRIAQDDLDAAFVPYWLLLGEDGPRVVEAIGARRIFAIHLPREDAPLGWWGDEGSLEGTVRALEAFEGVTALVGPSGHRIPIRR